MKTDRKSTLLLGTLKAKILVAVSILDVRASHDPAIQPNQNTKNQGVWDSRGH